MAKVARATQSEAEGGVENTKGMTALRTAQALAVQHASRTDNPHSTTKAQVGLGSADNTSDAAKPVSTAQQTALNGKVPTTRTISTSGLATGGGDLSADRTINVPAASQAEAIAGVENTKATTSLRVAQAIAALAPGGGGTPILQSFGTRADAIAASIPSIASGGTKFITTAGFATVGDGGHAVYKRAISDLVEASPTFTAVNGSGSYTGASGAGGGMRDGADGTFASTWASTGGLAASLTADLGSDQYIAYVELQAIPNSFNDWGVVYLNGAAIKTKTAAATDFTIRNGVSGLIEGERLAFEVNATGRYMQVAKPTWLAMAEFRVFTAASGTMTARGGFKSADGSWWDLVPNGDGINVRQFGASGDGTTRDDVAWQRAADFLMAKNGGICRVPRGAYNFQSFVRAYGPISFVGEGKGTIILGSGTGDSSDRSLSVGTGLGDFSFLDADYSYPLTGAVTERHATGAISANSYVTLTWDDITGLSVGDTVYVWLGISTADVSTPVWGGFQVITAITPGTGTTGSVTFQTPMYVDISDPTTVDTGGSSLGNPKPTNKFHRMWKPIHIADNCGVYNMEFKRDTASGNIGYNALVCKRARNFTFQNIWGFDTLISILNLAEGENIIVDKLFVEKQSFSGAYPQGGSGLSGGTLHGLKVRDSVFNADGLAVYFEGHNERISFENCVFRAEGGATFPSFIGFEGSLSNGASIEGCKFSAKDFRRVYEGGSLPDGSSAPWQVRLSNISIEGTVTVQLDGSIGPLHLPGWPSMTKPQTIRRSIALTNGMSTANYKLPVGWISQIRGFFSSKTGVTVTQISGYADGSGVTEDFLGKFGTAGPVPVATGLTKLEVNPAHTGPVLTNTHVLTISTGTVTAGAFLYIEVDYYPGGFYAPDVDAFDPSTISSWS